MRRRSFIILLGGAATWPMSARAQKRTMPVIGVLDAGSENPSNDYLRRWADFLDGLKEAGHVVGKNVAIEMRKANSPSAQLPMLAKDLVDRQVAVIIAIGGESAVQAAKSATSTIPIVSANGFDLVKYGYAASLNRPGGNITGVTALSDQTLVGKQVGLLHELLPHATTFGYLSGYLGDPISDDMKNAVLLAASKMGLEAFVVIGMSERALEAAFATLVKRQASALLVGDFYWERESKIVALAAQHRVPAIYPGSEYVRVGGLMSYGSILITPRQIAVQYIGPILKGAKPADMPIQQPTKFECVINLKTAKALNLEVPPAMLTLADEVIE